VALAAALLAAAALAAHSGARTKSVTIPSFEQGSVTARCPAGKSLASGGFSAAVGSERGLVVNEAGPSSARSWSAGAANVFVNDAKLSAIAACGPRRHLRRVSASRNLPGQSGDVPPSASVTATCPHGSSVRLAGFSADSSPQPDGPGLAVSAMRLASPRKWKVSAENLGPAAGSLRATALCGHGRSLRAARKSSPIAAAGGSASATARCRGRRRLAIGGFTFAPAFTGDGPYLSQIAPAGSHKLRAGAFQFSGNAGKLTAIAYCG